MPEPAQPVEDRALVLARGALAVGVLDAQEERAARAARVGPVEERRARAADVQLAGRARGEAEAARSESVRPRALARRAGRAAAGAGGSRGLPRAFRARGARPLEPRRRSRCVRHEPRRSLDARRASSSRALPKVLLHEHLDGGLRPATVLELARARPATRELPEREAERARPTGSSTGADARQPAALPRGLPPHDRGDADGASARARRLRVRRGHGARTTSSTPRCASRRTSTRTAAWASTRVMTAVLRGLARGSDDFGVELRPDRVRAAQPGRRSSRSSWPSSPSPTASRAASASTWPARRPATRPRSTSTPSSSCKRMNFSITIHAGESFGPESIWQALQYCGAHRIGPRHAADRGHRALRGPGDQARHAGAVRARPPHPDRGLPLDRTCTPARRASLAEHPFPLLLRPGLPRHAQHRQPPDEPHDA